MLILKIKIFNEFIKFTGCLEPNCKIKMETIKNYVNMEIFMSFLLIKTKKPTADEIKKELFKMIMIIIFFLVITGIITFILLIIIAISVALIVLV
jgi:hypothetical protein